jgi:hypothetical protein
MLTQRRNGQWFDLAQAGCQGGASNRDAQCRAIETHRANIQAPSDLSQRGLQRHQALRIMLEAPESLVLAQPLQRRRRRTFRAGWVGLKRDRSAD